ncbi:hypothetical protein A0H81_02307 [Grifola frondosa]|uniref:Uncharacterized protein n=1 Tax=Grifola frondosa TaxID=5627 RepID=A0A1C7MMB0_GRIFR|nr:hypothetical protein A0H81_02307 [Grifola frondosa]
MGIGTCSGIDQSFRRTSWANRRTTSTVQIRSPFKCCFPLIPPPHTSRIDIPPLPPLASPLSTLHVPRGRDFTLPDVTGLTTRPCATRVRLKSAMHSPLEKHTFPIQDLGAQIDILHELWEEVEFGDAYPSERSAYINSERERWVQNECKWALSEAADSAVSLPNLFDENEEDACLPSTYDPSLFSPSALSPCPRSFKLQRRNDKPLPDVPPVPRVRQRPSLPLIPTRIPSRSTSSSTASLTPPSSPLTPTTPSPPSSPRAPAHFASSPKSRTFPSSQFPPVVASSNGRPFNQRHATYPSISSTLSFLEDRETEMDKRSGVYVAEVIDQNDRTYAPSSSRIRGGSIELQRTQPLNVSPKRKQRPPLPSLSTSISSPSLRTLAALSVIPPPPLSPSALLCSPMSDATINADVDALAVDNNTIITSFPTRPSTPTGEASPGLASRWSMDSVASRPHIDDVGAGAATSPTTPPKQKKRDRLLSFISRGRAGSVGKPATSPSTPRMSTEALDLDRRPISKGPHFEMISPSRPSLSVASPPVMSPSASTSSSSSSSSASSAFTVVTPVESPSHNALHDRMEQLAAEQPQSAQHSPEAIDSSLPYLQDSDVLPVPSEPTLPLPSPRTPTASFLSPPRAQSFFSLSALKSRTRRRKKLVISGGPLAVEPIRHGAPPTPQDQYLDALNAGRREREQRLCHENVRHWCEGFGAVRKIERKEDGSLHVYWKEWQIADMVCRLQAQVYMKGVGRVNLSWDYVS